MKPTRLLNEISDGKIYDIFDHVKADTHGCDGCSACCHDVGDLVVLTPFDVYEICHALNVSFEALVDVKVTLRPQNKLMLPYLKMEGQALRCSFLNEANRCSIHGSRPSICRLFPLGRIYEQDHIKYFLQVDSCLKKGLQEVKVSDWIGIQNYDQNTAFLLVWHQFIKALTFRVKFIYDEAELEKINQYLLKTFYKGLSEKEEDFYAAFAKVLPEAKSYLGIL